jgi:hypothetical protein
LVDWARRSGGDRLRTEREALVADGTTRAALNDTGDIHIVGLTLDGLVQPSGYTLDGNVITFGSAPVDGAELDVSYTVSRYSDLQVAEFLHDAARNVQSDLAVKWRVTADAIEDIADILFVDGVPDNDFERLIVCRAAVAMYEDKSNVAADDAIKIRDGDTQIDTSATSQSTNKALARLWEYYHDARESLRSRRFLGAIEREDD